MAWPGPSHPGRTTFAVHQQTFFDELTSCDDADGIGNLFVDQRNEVVEVGSGRVPYDPDGEAWHAPTTWLERAIGPPATKLTSSERRND
jgi:hypothetical protein